MFTARPSGTTLKRAQDAIANPHDPLERVDPNFRVAMRCDLCGKLAYGPRALIRDAVREHKEMDCPMRHTHADEPQIMRILFPRQ